MNSKLSNLTYLRLVDLEEGHGHSSNGADSPSYTSQVSLFSDASDETLGFIEASKLEAPTFQRLLEEVKPRQIFDLRMVPSFAIGHLTRKTVFALFDAYEIRYFDLTGALGIRSHRDTALNPRLLVPNILKNVLKSARPLTGPILFFVDSELLTEDFVGGVDDVLPNQNNRGWEISIWESQPKLSPTEEERSLVFVSHANPEDNEIALWFCTRLAAEGFDVWSDVTRLIGGEIFWDSIEDVIRNKAACVVVLLSKDGHEKLGVLDEVNVAIAQERRLNLENFVVPVRIDELPFSSIRANLARKNVIDASGELVTGFRDVVAVLDGKNVPRNRTDAGIVLTKWRARQSSLVEKVDQSQWDLLIENSLGITKWPVAIRRFSNVRTPAVYKAGFDSNDLGVASGPQGHFSFGSRTEAEKFLRFSGASTVSGETLVSSVIEGNASDIFDCKGFQLFKVLSSLVRQGWNSACDNRGMERYFLANNRVCWFCKLGFNEKNEIRFVDALGRRPIR